MDVYDDWQDLDKPQKNLSTDVTKRGIVQQLRGGMPFKTMPSDARGSTRSRLWETVALDGEEHSCRIWRHF